MSDPNDGNRRSVGDVDPNFASNFINDIPPVTRTLFLLTLIATPLSIMGFLPITAFVLQWPYVIQKFQIWRVLLTFVHAGGLGFGFLIHMYFLYTYSRQVEQNLFFGRTANYCWMLTIVMAVILLLSPIFRVFFGGRAILMSIIHFWARHAGTLTVSLYGFITIPAKYLSIAMLCIGTVIGGGIPWDEVAGLIAGHLYYFLDSVYPEMEQGKHVIFTPPWFVRLVESIEDLWARAIEHLPGFGQQSTAPTQQGTSSRITGVRIGNSTAGSTGARTRLTNPVSRPGHSWGRGHTLGSS